MHALENKKKSLLETQCRSIVDTAPPLEIAHQDSLI